MDTSEEDTLQIKNLLEPSILKSPPAGLIPDLKLTFDEFVVSHPNITIQKLPSNRVDVNGSPLKCYTILETAKQLREIKKKEKKDAYFFSLAMYEELDEAFKIPNNFQIADLFTQFWPKKSMSNYLRSKSKLFYCYTKGYKSNLEKLYGGMCEWIYLLTGKIEFVLYEPTKINLAKFTHLEPGEKYNPEINTDRHFTLNEGEFFYIPSNWITSRSALADSFAITGEFLNFDNICNQLNSLEQDVIITNGKYSLDRDYEIRHLYWFAAASWLGLESKKIIHKIDNNGLVALKDALLNWKKLHKTTVAPHVYAPNGLQISQICKDLSNVVSVRSNRSRISLKSSTDSINLVADQTTINNQSD